MKEILIKIFPDEKSCLDYIMVARFGHSHTCGKCGVVDATFHRLENRKAYACAHCGDNLYPCAGTIFEKSRTPLTVWFYAAYLVLDQYRAAELRNILPVTQKCAYRMYRAICVVLESQGGFPVENAILDKIYEDQFV